MKKLLIVLVLAILTSCSNGDDYIENLIDENQSIELQSKAKKNKKNKFKEIEIPFLTGKFTYILTPSDKKVRVSGSIVEAYTNYPLIVRLNENSTQKKIVLFNDTLEPMYVALNRNGVSLPTSLVQELFMEIGLYAYDLVTVVPPKNKLVIKYKYKKNIYKLKLINTILEDSDSCEKEKEY